MIENTVFKETVFICPLFKVEHAKVRLPDESVEDRWYVVKNDAVGIVAVNESNQILLTREFRSAAATMEWGIPAGGLKDDETPINGAHRELREETGYDANSLEFIGVKKYPSSLVKQTTYFFLARELFESPLQSGEFEDIKVVPTDILEVNRKIKNEEIRNHIAEFVSLAIDKLSENQSP
jgi:ADP-ribose pyrophosphatase